MTEHSFAKLAFLLISFLLAIEGCNGDRTFPQSPPLASQTRPRSQVSSCGGSDFEEAGLLIRTAIYDFLWKTNLVDDLIPCTPANTGLDRHCPASSCNALFEESFQNGYLFFSGLYWVEDRHSPNGINLVECDQLLYY